MVIAEKTGEAVLMVGGVFLVWWYSGGQQATQEVIGNVLENVDISTVFAKGGKQSGENEYTREAKAIRQAGGDAAAWLAQQMKDAKKRGDTKAQQKIKAAQKFLDFRHHG